MKDNAESANETQKPNIDERTIRLVENFKTRSKSANRVVVILISVMITFWLSGLEPKGDAIANYLGVSKRRSEEITKPPLSGKLSTRFDPSTRGPNRRP